MDYARSEAFRRGTEAAVARLALQPPDDHTVSVSVEGETSYDDRTFYKMCQLCTWPRASDLCPHDDLGEIQLRETRAETEGDLDLTSPEGVSAE
jgi:hypothetical protein